MEQVEKRVLGTEDKVEELYQTVKDHEKMLRKYGACKTWDTMKRPNLQIMAMKEK
jgi:hypothetical protein